MRTSWVGLSIKNITTQASREMTSRKISKFSILMGERCQALACGGVRYLPSLIALLSMFCFAVLKGQLSETPLWGHLDLSQCERPLAMNLEYINKPELNYFIHVYLPVG